MTSGQEMERVYSYNPGACTGRGELQHRHKYCITELGNGLLWVAVSKCLSSLRHCNSTALTYALLDGPSEQNLSIAATTFAGNFRNHWIMQQLVTYTMIQLQHTLMWLQCYFLLIAMVSKSFIQLVSNIKYKIIIWHKWLNNYLMTTFRCPLDILFTSCWLFTAHCIVNSCVK